MATKVETDELNSKKEVTEDMEITGDKSAAAAQNGESTEENLKAAQNGESTEENVKADEDVIMEEAEVLDETGGADPDLTVEDVDKLLGDIDVEIDDTAGNDSEKVQETDTSADANPKDLGEVSKGEPISKESSNGTGDQPVLSGEDSTPKEVKSQPEAAASQSSAVPSTTSVACENTETGTKDKKDDDVSLIVHVDDDVPNDLDADIEKSNGDGTSSDEVKDDVKMDTGEATGASSSGDGDASMNKSDTVDAKKAESATAEKVDDKKEGKKDGHKGKSSPASKSTKPAARPANSGRNLWISGLASTTRAADLKTLFNKHGKVAGAKIVTSAKAPGSRCFGYVIMQTTEEAGKCIKHLHRTELHGRMISVEKARNDPAAQGLIKNPESKAVTKTTAKPTDKKDDAKLGQDKRDNKRDTRRDDHRRRSDHRDNRHERKYSHGSSRHHSGGDKSRSGEVMKSPDSSKSVQKDKPEDSKTQSNEKDKTTDAKEKTEEDKTELKSKDEEKDKSAEKSEDKDKSKDSTTESKADDKPKEKKDILSFDKIKEERERERLRQRERQMRETERIRRMQVERDRRRQKEIQERQREEGIRLARERENLRRQREEMAQLQQERERIRFEREQLHHEKLEAERLERERIRLERERRERERLEREREMEQKRIEQLRFEEQQRKERLHREELQRKALKRAHERNATNDDGYWANAKKPAPSNQQFDSSRKNVSQDKRQAEFRDRRLSSGNVERRVVRYDRRVSDPESRDGAKRFDERPATTKRSSREFSRGQDGPSPTGKRDVRERDERTRTDNRYDRFPDRGLAHEQNSRDRHGSGAVTRDRSNRVEDHHERHPHSERQTHDKQPHTERLNGFSSRDAPMHRPDSRPEWKTSHSAGSQAPDRTMQDTRRETHSRYQDTAVGKGSSSGGGGRDQWGSNERSKEGSGNWSGMAAGGTSVGNRWPASATSPPSSGRSSQQQHSLEQPVMQTASSNVAFLSAAARAANIMMGGLSRPQANRYDAYKNVGTAPRRY